SLASIKMSAPIGHILKYHKVFRGSYSSNFHSSKYSVS
ncbi:MAG: hypothetical protein ACJAXX_002830, partial [Roseivirga sp.]